MEKSKLLDRCGAEGEDRLLLAKVLDRAAQAEERNIPACTDFLSPQQQMMAGDLLRLAGIPETAWLRQGGYQGAERNILLFLPDWMEPEMAESPLRCLRASFRAEERLSWALLLDSLTVIVSFFFFNAGTEKLPQGSDGNTVLLLVVFLAVIALAILLQQKTVDRIRNLFGALAV